VINFINDVDENSYLDASGNMYNNVQRTETKDSCNDLQKECGSMFSAIVLPCSIHSLYISVIHSENYFARSGALGFSD
jgi:hypothetical protein